MAQEGKSQVYPFDFIDRLLTRDQTSCRVIKMVTTNEWSLYPDQTGAPCLAWFVLVETMAQTAGRLDEYRGGFQYQSFLTRLHNVHWQRPAYPGEALIIEARLLKAMEHQAAYHVQVTSNDELLTEGDFYFGQTVVGLNQRT